MDKLIINHPFPIIDLSLKKDIQGWLNSSNKILLKKYINLLPSNSIILELGVWKGLSTLYMLELFNGTIICVDNWSGGESILPTENKKKEHNPTTVYNQFLRNIHESKDRIIQINMDGCEAIKYLYNSDIKPSLIYLDMDHTYPNIKKDLKTIYSYYPDITIIGDDYEFYNDVKKAVNEFIYKHNYFLEVYGNCYSLIPKNDTIIEYTKFNKINIKTIECNPDYTMKCLVFSVNDNHKNVVNMLTSFNIEYKLIKVDLHTGKYINANIIHYNTYNVIILLLGQNTISQDSSYCFANFPNKPIIFDHINNLSFESRIHYLSISRQDYYCIEGLPNISDINLISATLYLRISYMKNNLIYVPKYNFESFIKNNKKIFIKDPTLFIENSFQNGINSLNFDYVSKTTINLKYPQHNYLYYQNYLVLKLNSINNINIKTNIKNNTHLTKKIEEFSKNVTDTELRTLLINNSAFYNSYDNLNETILEMFYILNLKKLYEQKIAIISHINNVSTDIELFVNQIYSVINYDFTCYINKKPANSKIKLNCKKIEIINTETIINTTDKYDFVVMNIQDYFYKLQFITNNLLPNSSLILYQETTDELLLETILSILSFIFKKVIIYKPNYFMAHIKYVYIIAKYKINEIIINKADNILIISNPILKLNENLFQIFYKYQLELINYTINSYNETATFKNKYPKEFINYKNILINKKKKVLELKSINAKLNNIYLSINNNK